MRKALIPAFLLMLGSLVLGATVMREPLAHAASAMSVMVSNSKSSPVPVQEVNTDANGYIKVHEQGTANVSGDVAASPAAPASPFKVDEGFLIGHVLAIDELAPSAVPINITSLTVSASNSFNIALIENQVPAATTTCPSSGGGDVWEADNVSAPLTVPFPTPLQFSAAAGSKVCIEASVTPAGVNEGDFYVKVSASGFYGG